MNAVWVLGSILEAEFDVAVSKAMLSSGVRVSAVTDLGNTYVHLRNKKIDIELIPLQRHRDVLPLQEVERIFKNYPLLDRLIRIDDSLKQVSNGEARQLGASYILYWESYLTKHGVDAVITMGTRGLAGRTCFVVAKKRGLQTLEFLAGSKFYGNFSITDNGELAWLWTEVITAFEMNKEKPVTAELKHWVQATLSDWQACRAKVKYKAVTTTSRRRLPGVLSRLKTVVNRVLLFMPVGIRKMLIFAIQKGWPQFSFSATAGRPRDLPRFAFERDDAFLEAFRSMNERRYRFSSEIRPYIQYAHPQQGDKFVYFPLYFEGDTPLQAWGEFIYDQLGTAKKLADMLPEGYVLYVKQHPYGGGDFSIQQLRDLQSHSRIRLIDPSVDNLELLQTMSLMINIGSSAAYEAFLARKPIAVLTKPFYAYCDAVYIISNPNEAKEIMEKALKLGPSVYDIYDQEWHHLVHAIFSTVYEGEVWDYKQVWSSAGTGVYAPGNVEKVAEQVARKINHKSLNVPLSLNAHRVELVR